MDILSHGLWGGAVFGKRQSGQYKWAFFWGMAPDLFSFGPFFLTHLPTLIQRWGSHNRMEPPDPRIIPAYVYHAYNVTHSLVVWGITFGIVWFWKRSAGRGFRTTPESMRGTGLLDEKQGRGRSTGEGSIHQENLLPHPASRTLPLWPLGAWALHILCDIPTHSTRFFPTPFLWPFQTPFVDGRPWGRPPFTLINYGLLAATYLGFILYRKYNPKNT